MSYDYPEYEVEMPDGTKRMVEAREFEDRYTFGRGLTRRVPVLVIPGYEIEECVGGTYVAFKVQS